MTKKATGKTKEAVVVGLIHLTANNKIVVAAESRVAATQEGVASFVNENINEDEFPTWKLKTPTNEYLISSGADRRVECEGSFSFWDDMGGRWVERDSVGDCVAACCVLEGAINTEAV